MHSQRFIGMYSQMDVKLIFLQMCSLQFLFYLSQLILLFILSSVYGRPMHVGQVFDLSIYEWSSATPQFSYMSYLTNLLTIPVMIAGLSNIVVKANKVLDFVATVFGYHFFFSAIYSNRLFDLRWLCVNGIILLITVLVGEYVCIKLEQLEIKFLDNLFVALGPNKEKVRKMKTETMNGKTRKYFEMNDVIEV